MCTSVQLLRRSCRSSTFLSRVCIPVLGMIHTAHCLRPPFCAISSCRDTDVPSACCSQITCVSFLHSIHRYIENSGHSLQKLAGCWRCFVRWVTHQSLRSSSDVLTILWPHFAVAGCACGAKSLLPSMSPSWIWALKQIYHSIVIPAKTAESIKMPFGLRTRVVPRKQVLGD